MNLFFVPMFALIMCGFTYVKKPEPENKKGKARVEEIEQTFGVLFVGTAIAMFSDKEEQAHYWEFLMSTPQLKHQGFVFAVIAEGTNDDVRRAITSAITACKKYEDADEARPSPTPQPSGYQENEENRT
jgi:hypothetical protein